MNRNNFLQKVIAKVSDKIDGDTLLMAEQMIPVAIANVTKRVVYSGDPSADLLVVSRIIMPAGTKFDYDYINVANTLVRTADRVLFRISSVSESTLLEPVQSLNALALSETHKQSYYFWDGSIVLYSLANHVGDTEGLEVEHYEYRVLDDGTDDSTHPFPDELEDALFTEMVALLTGEQQKQMMDEVKPNNATL